MNANMHSLLRVAKQRVNAAATTEDLERHWSLLSSILPSVPGVRVTHTPLGLQISLSMPGKSPKVPSWCWGSTWCQVSRWRGKTAKSVASGASDLQVSERVRSVLPSALCFQQRLWLVTRGGNCRLAKIQRPLFNAHLIRLQLVRAFLMGVEGDAASSWVVKGPQSSATAICLRNCLQVLCPSTGFFPLGTVPVLHKILCIGLFSSSPVSSVF